VTQPILVQLLLGLLPSFSIWYTVINVVQKLSSKNCANGIRWGIQRNHQNTSK